MGEFERRSLGRWKEWIVPVFASYSVSSPCHSSCEFAEYSTECKCKTCGGLNHGRSQYEASKRPFNEKQYFVKNEAGQWRNVSRWTNGQFSWMADMTGITPFT